MYLTTSIQSTPVKQTNVYPYPRLSPVLYIKRNLSSCKKYELLWEISPVLKIKMKARNILFNTYSYKKIELEYLCDIVFKSKEKSFHSVLFHTV